MTNELQVSKKRKVNWFAVYSHASRYLLPLRGLRMSRFNVFPFYKLGACVAPLRLIKWLPGDYARDVLRSAHKQLAGFDNQKFDPFKVVAAASDALSMHIESALAWLGNKDAIYGDDDGLLLRSVREFETVLEAQAPTEHTYMIEQLRGYSMSILIDGADQNFSSQTMGAVGEDVRKDIKEAGRCLAFELPTAAGIHIMRAFEKVLRRFYQVSTGKDPGTTDIFKLINNLRQEPNSDPKILNILDQIRDLHRNPLAHEVFLDMDEAVDIFDISKSAITAMARKL